MSGFRRRLTEGFLDHLGDDVLGDRRLARRPRLVAQQTVDPLGHKALLPAPHTRLALACLLHDFMGAETGRGQQNNLRPPHMFL